MLFGEMKRRTFLQVAGGSPLFAFASGEVRRAGRSLSAVNMQFDPAAVRIGFRVTDSECGNRLSINGREVPFEGSYPLGWKWNGGWIFAVIPRDLVPYSMVNCEFQIRAFLYP
jgi:hypothetical protein